MKKPYGGHILITGASSGLGLACAQAFAQAGYTVWGVSRGAEEKEAACGAGCIHFLRMDVNDGPSVEAAVAEILGRAGQLGIVLHCAGFGIAGAAEDTPLEMARQQMETNYFGVLRVNAAVLPHMRRQGRGLILVMSSVAGVISIPYQSHYASSKFALEAYVEALRLEGRPFGLRASLIEPGDTRTGFTAARRLCIPEYSAYASSCRAAVAVMERDEQNGKPPESVARVALRLASKKNPPVRRAVGMGYRALVLLKRLLPARLVEMLLRRIYLGAS